MIGGRVYRKAVLQELKRTNEVQPGLLTEADMTHLPPAVQKYLRYTGMVGREKVISFRAEFKGDLQAP